MSEPTRAEMILLAAGALLASGKEEFSAEDLVVQAFIEFPSAFSLKGHPEHPDSNRVFTKIMGRSAPLITRGWLEKTGTKTYRLTPKGLDDLQTFDARSGATTTRIEREKEARLGQLFDSHAYKLFSRGQETRITFHHFCRFAGLSAKDKWQKVQGRIAAVDHLVGEAESLGESGQSLSVHYRGTNQVLSSEELRSVAALWHFLKERFAAQMEAWRRKGLG